MTPRETPEHRGEHRKMLGFAGVLSGPGSGLSGVEADALFCGGQRDCEVRVRAFGGTE
jgi:hypothetical protein